MKKRALPILLALAMFFSQLPVQTYAKTSGNMYGDVNGDEVVDLRDLLTLKKYISEDEQKDFVFVNADLNADQKVDLKDYLILKKYFAEWDVHLGAELLTVSFYDGDRLIDILPAEKGYPLGELPSKDKSKKDNAILEGYYIDKEYTNEFYSEDKVTDNINVYAKYREMGGKEELNITSFAQMDQNPDMVFNIKRTSGEIEPKEAATLVVKDGSDNVELKIEDVDNDGVYTVSAPKGFNEGCSYELNLADGWVFDGKEETIRTASFSIAMQEVENLEMNDDIKYIKDTDDITYTVDGEKYDVLTSDQVNADGGSFEYDNASKLKKDDIICLYVGVKPTDREANNGSELVDPAVYVKVASVDENKVIFGALDENDQAKVYNMPDNFPLVVESLPTEETGTVSLDSLDLDMYANMMGDDQGTYENAVKSIEAGDFITLYTSTDDIKSGKDLYYGEITAYNKDTKEITYKQTTKTAIEESMDLYSELSVSGSDIVSDEEKEKLEDIVQTQIEESDFGEEAANAICNVVTESNEFNENTKNVVITDDKGNKLTSKQLRKISAGKSFELSDKVKVNVGIITKGKQLHYNNGIQLNVGIEAEFEAEVDDGTVNIELKANFVEECELVPRVKGSIVTKEILFIPIPVGVSINTTIDVKNFTAFSFNANIYTVAEEDQSIWEKFKSIADDPSEALGLSNLPSGLKSGLSSVKDVMDKIEEVQAKIDQANDTAENLKGYKEDLDALWQVMEMNGTDKEQWDKMCNVLGKSNVASDVFGIMDLSDETELGTEFLDGMQDLMDKYSETLQKETDWVTLLNQEICSTEVCYFGVVIGTQVNFLIRADMNIAIGSNLEYEVGKRYNFWFKVGLFKPSAGSSSMDLLDEKFDFQFYVMGKLGLKSGIRAKFYAGIGSGKFASVGIAAELGPYVKLYGFFIYEYSKYRPANSSNTVSKERMSGALFLEFGLYFMMSFEANAIGNLFEYSNDFVDKEYPLLTAGRNVFYYNTAYEPSEDEVIVVRDEDGDRTNGITMDVPKDVLALSYVELNTGVQGVESLHPSNYNIRFTNRNFSVDYKTGKINVNVPENTRYMAGEMTITYLHSKVAFSQYDMTVTVPIVWTNLTTEELKEYYTASVRVGNNDDGYKTVWTKKVLKNEEFNLPTEDQLKEILNWNDYKYTLTKGYNGQKTENVTLVDNTSYDYYVDYKTYSITVNGIENANGTKRSQTFYAKFGESFDFSDLEDTGSNRQGAYNKFAGVTTTATINVNGSPQVIDLKQPINSKIAEALSQGVTATANYVDDSTTATFVFNGIDVENAVVKVKRGTIPNYDFFEVAQENNTDVISISPEVTKISSPTTYYVECKNVIKKLVTMTFDTMGGSTIDPITRKETTVLPTIPVPVKKGYVFDGWCTDPECNNLFTSKTVPTEDITLYAKWKPAVYTVIFKENGGNELETNTKKVTYTENYGELPTPVREGYAFLGWYTDIENGEQVKANDQVLITSSLTLYAHWRKLKPIPSEAFVFTPQSYYYDSDIQRIADYTFNPPEGLSEEETYTEDSFTIKYKSQSKDEYEEGLPSDVGVYDVVISRPADQYYLKFEKLYDSVLIIKPYDLNGSYYSIYVSCRDTVGGKQKLNNTISWANGATSSFSLDMDTKTRSGSISGFASYPTQIHLESSGRMVGQHVIVSTRVSDITGNTKTIKDGHKEYWANQLKYTWGLGSYPVVNYTAGNYQVTENGKIKVRLNTYGNSGKVSNLAYSTSSSGTNSDSCVTVDGDYFIIDGKKLTEENHNINVFAKYGSSGYVQVSRFTVSHIAD